MTQTAASMKWGSISRQAAILIALLCGACLVESLASVIGPPPPPRYRVDSLGGWNDRAPSLLSEPESAADLIGQSLGQVEYPITFRCGMNICSGTMRCSGQALPFSSADFQETSPNLTNRAYPIPGTRPVSYQTAQCTAGDAFGVCLANACLPAPVSQYTMFAVCEAADTVFRSNPARCECRQPFPFWSQEHGRCVRVIERFHRDRPRQQCGSGNPIYPLSGDKRQDESLPLGGRFGRLAILYDTQSKVPTTDGTLGLTALPATSLGGLWSTSLHRNLALQVNQYGEVSAVQAHRGGGRWIGFALANGQYTAAADVRDWLIQVGNGWRYYDMSANAIETYDSSGVLSRITTAAGDAFEFAYSTPSTSTAIAPVPGLLIAVQDTFGRTVQFAYESTPEADAGARLVRVIDSAGAASTIDYSGVNPMRLSWPDGSSRQFLYERADLPWALTGVVDELGSRMSRYGYDATGRATSTELAGGANRYSVTWSTPPSWHVMTSFDANTATLRRDHFMTAPQGVVVDTPQGTSISHGAVSINGAPFPATQSQPAGAGCPASSSATTYDVNGNTASKLDFNGVRTCFGNDLARNLETVRVEGLASEQACGPLMADAAVLPAGSRKTSTRWHSIWRLRSRVAEPGRMTTWVYNGQPDPFSANTVAWCAPATARLPDGQPIAVPCRQVEQATMDTDGTLGFAAVLDTSTEPRIQSWTYNAFGQVLTHDGPRTDVSDVSTFTYFESTTDTHTKGDLQRAVDAVGSTTTYSHYRPSGQWLQSIDPNGVVETRGYDHRHRLVSSTVAGQTTTYSYAPTGLLQRMTQPDGSYIGFEYDAAHRQKAVFDGLGNRIEYTLDNAGNLTAEHVKDPSGALRRQRAWLFDALGRVQRATGSD